MGQFLWWVFVKFLLPALIGYLSEPVIARAFNTDNLRTFAASGSGANSLIVGIVIGVFIHFMLTSDIKWVKDLQAKVAGWLAGFLRGAAAKIQPEVPQ